MSNRKNRTRALGVLGSALLFPLYLALWDSILGGIRGGYSAVPGALIVAIAAATTVAVALLWICRPVVGAVFQVTALIAVVGVAVWESGLHWYSLASMPRSDLLGLARALGLIALIGTAASVPVIVLIRYSRRP